MDLRRQGQVIRSWIWLLVASVLLAGGAAYLVSSSLPKVYEGTATLLVGQSSSSSSANYNDLLASQRISQTYADLATTGPILDQVIANAGLGLTTDEFRQLVNADAPANSTLVTVTVRTAIPRVPPTLANALAAQLIAASDSVYGKNGQVQDFVTGQISAAQAQIKETQAEIDASPGCGRAPPPRTSSFRRSGAGSRACAGPTPHSWASPGRPRMRSRSWTPPRRRRSPRPRGSSSTRSWPRLSGCSWRSASRSPWSTWTTP